MRMGVLVAGMLFLVMGLIGIAEGVLMIKGQDPRIYHDLLGPGRYLIIVSIALIISGGIYTIHHRKSLAEGKLWEGKETLRAVQVIAILAISLLLIEIIGYFGATLIFYLLVLRVLGIRSWLQNIILTVVFSIIFYILFVWGCGMVFPPGILFP